MVKKVDVSEARKMPGVHAVRRMLIRSTSRWVVSSYAGLADAYNGPIAGSERTGCDEPAVRPALPVRGRRNCGGGGRDPSQAWDAVCAIKVEYE